MRGGGRGCLIYSDWPLGGSSAGFGRLCIGDLDKGGLLLVGNGGQQGGGCVRGVRKSECESLWVGRIEGGMQMYWS